MKSATDQQRGSAILGVLIVALLIVALGGTYLRTAYNDYRYSRELMMGFQALNLAEGGIEHAVLALNSGDWSDWTLEDTGDYSRTFNPYSQRKVRVVVDPGSSPALIFAEGLVDSQATPEISRQLLVELSKRGLFANGLTARNGLVLNGNKIMVDSYRSSDGPYDPVLNRRDNGTVASTSIEEGIVEVDNADIWGYVATGGGEPEIGPNGSIRGTDTDPGVDVDPNRVSYDFYADFPTVTSPDTSTALTSYGGSMGVAGTTTTYEFSSLTIGNGNTVTVYGDVTVVVGGETEIKGELRIAPDSSLKIYAEDDFNIGGTGLVNATNTPEALQIYGVGNSIDEIKLHGSATLYATVYAPNTPVNLKGGGSVGAVYGAIVGKSITLNGNYEFHYDEDLADLGDSGYRIMIWRELVAAADRKDFSVLKANGL